jgi:prepilin-type N-terminal cleavage/methylation domain-containing protein
MIKFFSRLKRRKGFTLVEMIVVVALIAIIMATVVAFSTPMRMSIRNSEARADAITINEIIGNYLERNIAYANRLDAFVGYNYSDSDTDIKKAFEDFYKASLSDSNTDVKLLVCKYFPGSDTAGTHGTMKIYDMKIAKTASGLPSLSDNDLVFADAFYGNYQYFITTDDTNLAQNTNVRTKKAYFNLKVESFNVDDGYEFDSDRITSHYKYVDKKAEDGTLLDDTLDELSYYKIGTEVVSFALENMKVGELSRIKTDEYGNKKYYSNGAPIWESTPTTPSATVTRKSDGTDLVILYKVKKYDYSK